MDPNVQNISYRAPPPKEVEPPRQRIDVACSRCRRRKIKCSGWSEEQPRCQGCIKADHPCEFVNRVSPIMVPSNTSSHSAPGTIASPGYSRPWSPASAASPRGYGPGQSVSAGHRRSIAAWILRAASGYSPSSYSFTPWAQQPQQQSPQDVADSYAGTGFHHLLDPSISGARPPRTDVGLESPTSVMVHSSLAQRRLNQREGSYTTYGGEAHATTSPLPSPISISGGQSSKEFISSPLLLSREESGYGKLMYAPLHVSSNPQLQSSTSMSSLHSQQIQNQSTQHISQKPVNFSPISSTSQHSQSSQSFPTPSPQSQTPQSQFPEQQQRSQYADQQPRMQYQDTQTRMPYKEQSRMPYQDPSQQRQQYPQDPRYSSEFVIPSNPRRTNSNDVGNSTSIITYSTTQSQSTASRSSSIEYPANMLAATPEYPYPRPTDRYPSPYKPQELQQPPTRVLSRPASRSDRTNLTPQTLADHTHVQESIHEQHIDAVKNSLDVGTGNEVQVIEYLDTLPRPQPQPRPQPGDT